MSSHGLGNQIFAVSAAGLALVAAPAMRFVLPEQFLLDDAHLQESIAGTLVLGDAEGFRTTAAVYEVLRLGDSPAAAAIVGIAAFVAAVHAALGWERLRDLSVIGLAGIAASYALALVYMAQYSKELFTLAIVVIALWSPRSRWGDVGVVLACIVYGAAMRPYWLLVAALYILWRLVLVRFRHPLLLLLVPVVAYAVLTPAFQVALGGGLQSQREWANAERASAGEVASMITSPLPGATGVLGIVSALLMILLLVVPVPLLISGSPYQMASGLLIVGIWGVALWPVLRGRLAARPPVVRIQAVRAASLLLALLLVQSLFEPDYGSYLKHLTPMLPLVLVLLPSVAALRPADAPADGLSAPAAGTTGAGTIPVPHLDSPRKGATA